MREMEKKEKERMEGEREEEEAGKRSKWCGKSSGEVTALSAPTQQAESASQWLVPGVCPRNSRSGGCLVPRASPWLTLASEMQATGDQIPLRHCVSGLPVCGLMNCNTLALPLLGRFRVCFVSLNNGANIPDSLCPVYTFIGFNPKPMSAT